MYSPVVCFSFVIKLPLVVSGNLSEYLRRVREMCFIYRDLHLIFRRGMRAGTARARQLLLTIRGDLQCFALQNGVGEA